MLSAPGHYSSQPLPMASMLSADDIVQRQRTNFHGAAWFQSWGNPFSMAKCSDNKLHSHASHG